MTNGNAMAVYVDAYQVPATVGRITARWSHLTADTRSELETFARRLGLKPEWFQSHPVRWHYDVTENIRQRALKLGAVEVDFRGLGRIMAERREALKAAESGPGPCRWCCAVSYRRDALGPVHGCCDAWREVILAGYACPSCQVAGYYMRWEAEHPGRPAPKLNLRPLPLALPDGRRFAPDIGGRLAITASREWDDPATMRRVLEPYRRRGLVLVHGGARGGDKMAAKIWAEWGETADEIPADWVGPCRDSCKPGHRKTGRGREYCPAAGMYRNAGILDGAFRLEAFVRDGSSGATGCVELAQARGIKYEISRYQAEAQAG